MASGALNGRNLFAHLPPPAECFAILVGVMELSIFGLGGLANPTEFAKGYGLPLPSSSASSTATSNSTSGPTAAVDLESGAQTKEVLSHDDEVQRTHKALVAAIAARNVQNGILLLTFACYTRDRRALGIAVGVGLVTTVADTLIVRAYGVKEAVFGHVIGVFNSAAIGGALLYWGRGDKLW